LSIPKHLNLNGSARSQKLPSSNKFSPAEKDIIVQLENGLSDTLFYHGLHHTFDVFNAALQIASNEQLSPADIKILRIAILYHDSGFITSYKNHEEKGCEMARKNLPEFGFSKEEIAVICGMIMATKIPQNPHTLLENIICDADLDYLGRNDFDKISNYLFEEMKIYTDLRDEKKWYSIQKKFLESHHYHTDFSKKKRKSKKQSHLRKINKKVLSNK
jgi:predicted metal-dependent HD superfamily phosphohydrolase